MCCFLCVCFLTNLLARVCCTFYCFLYGIYVSDQWQQLMCSVQFQSLVIFLALPHWTFKSKIEKAVNSCLSCTDKISCIK
jgi:hypothetical protein